MTTATVGACGSSVGCAGTTIQAPTTRYTSRSAPLTFRARLLADGKPLSGVRLDFFLTLTGGGAKGILVGHATTGDDGIARLTTQFGLDNLVLIGQKETGYRVQVQFGSDYKGHNYCDASTTAALTG